MVNNKKELKLTGILTLVIVLFSYLSPSCLAQTDTNFWFAAPEVINAHGDRPIFLRIASLDQPAVISISEPANNAFATINFNLAANSSKSIDLTPFIDLIEDKPVNQVLNFGLFISSTAKITAYYEVDNPINPEIFALKGKNALGTEFFTPFQNFTNNGQGYSSFEIVATENNTTTDHAYKSDCGTCSKYHIYNHIEQRSDLFGNSSKPSGQSTSGRFTYCFQQTRCRDRKR